MKLQKWIEKYEAKSGEKHIVPQGFQTLFDKKRGYAQIKIEGETISVYEVCGDGRYWYHRANDIGKKNKCKWLFTICTRNILPYIRLMGAKWTEQTVDESFHNAIKGQGINYLGNRFIVLPAWYDEEKHTIAYNVFSEIAR